MFPDVSLCFSKSALVFRQKYLANNFHQALTPVILALCPDQRNGTNGVSTAMIVLASSEQESNR
jgi:hypothetical protein